MREPLTVETIRALVARITPGPWRWAGYTNGRTLSNFRLHTHGRGGLIVMDFRRNGMDGAEPRFRDHDRCLMRDARDLVRFKYEGSSEIVGVNHPDAEALERLPEIVEVLLDRIAELERDLSHRSPPPRLDAP